MDSWHEIKLTSGIRSTIGGLRFLRCGLIYSRKSKQQGSVTTFFALWSTLTIAASTLSASTAIGVRLLYFQRMSFLIASGYHSAKDGVLDFESGAHNFTKLFDLAKQVGLYILFRPGPYVNAEATAGGFPGWLTTGAYGTLRNNDTRYTDAWTPYFTKMSEIVAQHQVSNGGNVFIYQIENEYGDQWKNVAEKIPDPPAISYMELLESCARNAGINAVVFAGETSLGESLALFKRAVILISADSGPLHLASSVGASVLGIFGPTRVDITGPRGNGKSRILFNDVGCNKAPCYHLTCSNNLCMQSVTVNDVIQAFKEF